MPKSRKPPTETKVTTPKPTECSEQSHSVSLGTVPDPQDLERNILLARGSIQPFDKDLTLMTFDKGTAKITPHPEGSLGDKDSRGNITPAGMELIHPTVADPSGTSAKYQTFAKVQAFLLSVDELDKEGDEEEVLAAGEDIDEDPLVAKEVRTPPPKQDQKMLRVLFSRITKKQWEPNKEAANALKHEVFTLRQDTSEIKSMMTEFYQAFEGQSSSAPSSSVTLTLALTNIPVNIKRENVTNTATKEPLSHIEGKTKDPKMAISISSIQPTKICYLGDKEIQAYLDKEEKLRKAAEEARLLAISNPKVIKVMQEEAKKIRLGPKKVTSAKAGEKFKKAKDAEHQGLKRKNLKKVKKLTELNKRRAKEYMNNGKRNFDVHNPFKFTDFRITELGLIIQKKKNSIVKDLMTSLSKRYERLKKILKEYGIQSAHPALLPKQASSQTSGRKRNQVELKPKVKVHGLECNRSLRKGVPFVNNMVIEEPKYGIFFMDVFSDHAF
nr:hypothetical protein [Tanacetum cinerariifolium]